MKIIINLGREILLLGSVRESIMKPSETSSGKIIFLILIDFEDIFLTFFIGTGESTRNNILLFFVMVLLIYPSSIKKKN
jgi:hypothetical protein